jgi:hypothetical protein
VTSLIVNPHPALCGRSTDGRQRRADLLADINDGYVVTDEHLLTNVVDPDRVDVTLSPGATTQPVIRPRLVINHTRSCTTRIGSPHLYVLTSGMVEQYLPFIRRARGSFDADLWHHNGAAFGAITHQSEDNDGRSGDGVAIDDEPWSSAQVDALVAVTAAECVVYGIAPARAERWNDSGIGHHAQHPHRGVAAWSPAADEWCPGRARIAQMAEVHRRVAERVTAYRTLAGPSRHSCY